MEDLENKVVNLYDATSDIPQEEFKLAHEESNIHDTKFETRPIGWLEDSFRRFCKNKASVVGAIIIFIIALFAIIAPIASPWAKDDKFNDPNLKQCLPKLFNGYSGFWDGTSRETIGELEFNIKSYSDANRPYFPLESAKRIEKTIVTSLDKDNDGDGVIDTETKTLVTYSVQLDSYAFGTKVITTNKMEDFQAIVDYEKEHGISYAENPKKSILKPVIDYYQWCEDDYGEIFTVLDEMGVDYFSLLTIADSMRNFYNQNPNVYYKVLPSKERSGKWNSNQFVPYLDENGNIQPLYAKDDDGNIKLYEEDSTGKIEFRVDYFDYFTLTKGFKPTFIFGANAEGKDIFYRLAKGARFSLLLGIGISFVNFIIGLIWGAISGYYGGTADLIMERITDIIANVPTIIIMTITQIQLVSNAKVSGAIGPIGTVTIALLISFVYNGWVGVASTTRMQFYRFKGQEYVLASRTLGAKDRRLIFKHILPNAVGTLVTSSVLMIPGVIFSESSLSYLGIINFRTSGICSVGALLNEGQGAISTYPHMMLFPALVISLLMISFNLFGNGLRDAFNTTLRGSED
ncbi:MAG: ABC transporter permease [Bacilli bacterium]|nr:ABC transporter permease [Bacilli bacterium]